MPRKNEAVTSPGFNVLAPIPFRIGGWVVVMMFIAFFLFSASPFLYIHLLYGVGMVFLGIAMELVLKQIMGKITLGEWNAEAKFKTRISASLLGAPIGLVGALALVQIIGLSDTRVPLLLLLGIGLLLGFIAGSNSFK